MTPPTTTTPGVVSYLLVQEEKSVYKLLDTGHTSILPEDDLQLLLDDASAYTFAPSLRVCLLQDSHYGVLNCILNLSTL
jgi:hypothetical protein